MSSAIAAAVKLDLWERKPATYTEGSKRTKQLKLPMQRGSSCDDTRSLSGPPA